MRRQSTAFVLIDAAILSDPKFRALAKRLPKDDDFNSALGAYVIALAAARRNGLPDIDIEMETGSSFVEDLRAVGLINGSGFQEASFKAWAPRRPVYPSDLAPNATNAPSSPKGELYKSSTLLNSTQGEIGSGEERMTDEDRAANLAKLREAMEEKGLLPRHGDD